MNAYHGKICLLFIMLITYTSSISSSVLGRNRAFSNPETQKNLQDYQNYARLKQQAQAPCPTNSPVTSPTYKQKTATSRLLTSINLPESQHKTPPRRYSDSIMYFESPMSKDELRLIQGSFRTPRPQGIAAQVIAATIANKPFTLQPPILERQTNEPGDNIEQYYRAIQTVQTEHETRQSELQSELQKAIQHCKSQKKLSFLKASALVTPFTLLQILERQNQQSRFGLTTATTIISILPTAFTIIGAIYGVYTVDRMLHAEERIAISNLKREIKEDNDKRDKRTHKELIKLQNAVEKEIDERKKADQQLKQQFTHKITELEATNDKAIEKYNLGIDKLNDGCKTLEETKALNKTLMDQLAKIIPANKETLELAKKLVGFAKRSEANSSYDPRFDNIEYFISHSSDEENYQQSSNTSKKPTRQRSLSESTLQDGSHVNSNDFRKQFKPKKPKTPSMFSHLATTLLHTIHASTHNNQEEKEIEEEKEDLPYIKPHKKKLFSAIAKDLATPPTVDTSYPKAVDASNSNSVGNNKPSAQASSKKTPNSKTTPHVMISLFNLFKTSSHSPRSV